MNYQGKRKDQIKSAWYSIKWTIIILSCFAFWALIFNACSKNELDPEPVIKVEIGIVSDLIYTGAGSAVRMDVVLTIDEQTNQIVAEMPAPKCDRYIWTSEAIPYHEDIEIQCTPYILAGRREKIDENGGGYIPINKGDFKGEFYVEMSFISYDATTKQQISLPPSPQSLLTGAPMRVGEYIEDEFPTLIW